MTHKYRLLYLGLDILCNWHDYTARINSSSLIYQKHVQINNHNIYVPHGSPPNICIDTFVNWTYNRLFNAIVKSLRNEVHNLSDNTYVRNEIYREFYHEIVFIANEGCAIIYIYIYYILRSNKGIFVWPIWPEVNCPYVHTPKK